MERSILLDTPNKVQFGKIKMEYTYGISEKYHRIDI